MNGSNLSGGIVPVWSAPAEEVSDPAEAGRFGMTANLAGVAEFFSKKSGVALGDSVATALHTSAKPVPCICLKLAPFGSRFSILCGFVWR